MEQPELMVEEVTTEQQVDDEHKPEDEVVVISEQINLMVETEVVHIDIEVEVDGDDEIQVFEIVALMMTNEHDEEVVMLLVQLLIEY